MVFYFVFDESETPVYTVHMRLHRFFIEETVGNAKNIVINNEQLIHQWKKVFRYAPGDSVIVFDNSGYEYTASIEYIEGAEARLIVTHEEQKPLSTKREVYLFVSITKKDTFEWILEKATELGVDRVIPLISERSEKKDLNFERAKKIIIEASEQSGRVILPRLYEIATLTDALTHYDIPKATFDPTGSAFITSASGVPTEGPFAVYIGPEGGWSPKELELFRANKTPVYSLGTQVLRAETAAIAVLSLLLLR